MIARRCWNKIKQEDNTMKTIASIAVIGAVSLVFSLQGCSHAETDGQLLDNAAVSAALSGNQLSITIAGQSTAELSEVFSVYTVKHTFAPGDIVEWKPRMSHKKGEGPFVVLKVLETPVVDNESTPGSPYFNEQMDIVLCSLDQDNDFVCYHHDSNRFQPYKGDEL